MKIAFVGDCVIHNPDNHKIGDGLKQILNTCDVQVINFEAPVKFEGAKGIKKSGPVISQSADTPSWLEKAGFNVISLANNHMLDLQEKGLVKTSECFKDSILVGAGTYEDAHKAKGITLKGKSVGFIGLTHKEFGCIDCSNPDRLGTADISSPKTYTALAEALKIYDEVFVVAHAGVEYLDYPLPQWREMYKALIDMGALGVIGSHPHVPQGFEVYKGKPIFYSLGNFAFQKSHEDTIPRLWNSSILVVIDTDTDGFKWWPLKYNQNSGIIDIDSDNGIKSHIEKISEVLQDDKQYKEAILKELEALNVIYKSMATTGGLKPRKFLAKCKNLIRPLFNRKRVKPDYSHALNLFQCESHRWVMEYLLKTEKF